MAKVRNSFEVMARKAAENVAKVREQGQQLRLLPDEAGLAVEDVAKGTGGRPKGAKNKGSSELRKWLAAQGYRMPEELLAQMAGLNSGDPAVVQAMAQVELVMAWAFNGVKDAEGKKRLPSPEQKLSLLTGFMAIMERAAAALLPYGTPKATPDVNLNNQTVVYVAQAPTPAAQTAGPDLRDVTPEQGKMDRRMMPADRRYEIEQKQSLSKSETSGSDAEIRTDKVSR